MKLSVNLYVALAIVFTAGFVLLLVNTGEVQLLNKKYDPSELLHKLGEAFIVAAITGLLVDKYVKERLTAEVSRDVVDFALGYPLPKELQEEIRYLLRLPFVRKEFEIEITLIPITEKKGYVQLELITSFDLENLTDTSQKYEFRSRIESSFFPEVGLSQIHGIGMSGPKSWFLEDADLQAIIKDDRQFLSAQKSINVPSKSIRPLKFWTKRSAIYPDNYNHVLDLLEPTIGITVVVHSPPDFEWNVYFATRGEVEPFPEHHPHKWTHRGVHFPGQHVRITWIRRKDSQQKQEVEE